MGKTKVVVVYVTRQITEIPLWGKQALAHAIPRQNRVHKLSVQVVAELDHVVGGRHVVR